MGGSPVGGFPPCGVSPRGVWGLPPLRFLCRALLLAFMSCVPDASGVPVPGRPPGYKHGFGTPAAAERCSKQNVQGLPHLRSGSEYENNLHAAWANRVMELINSRASAAAAARRRCKFRTTRASAAAAAAAVGQAAPQLSDRIAPRPARRAAVHLGRGHDAGSAQRSTCRTPYRVCLGQFHARS